MTIVGITATRNGLTRQQREVLAHRLVTEKPELIVHGGCIGGDTEAHGIARLLRIPSEVHPSDLPDMQGDWTGAYRVHQPQPPLVRNRTIVRQSHLLIAMPEQSNEVRRSGTWTTVRFARSIGTPVVIINPNGDIA